MFLLIVRANALAQEDLDLYHQTGDEFGLFELMRQLAGKNDKMK
jgi:hypothetical protein